MITEDYCSFEIAKLLKEKGFNIPCRSYYNNNDYLSFEHPKGFVSVDSVYLLRPTHQMTLKWLREVYDLHIIVYPWQADKEEKAIHWCCTVYKSFAHLGNDVYTNETPKSYEEAIEAALLYVLKNLI